MSAGGLRVAVVGATGNVGTAVLRALHDADDVGSIVGIARRLPDQTAAPYAGVEWHSIDLANDPSEQLVTAFTGADAVIHLAWLIQPNRERELMRRVNVDGTAVVAKAAAKAGVRSLVVASSVGAYSPARTDQPHDESWPTEGIPSSHYSVDKAAQESFLDAFEEQHPDIAVARLRTALVFQRDAGAEIQRLFLGPLVPVRLIGKVPLPVVPLPQGIRLQAVHADDAAAAYVAAVRIGARGAFNIAADDLLGGADLARLVRGRRPVGVPPRVVRAAMAAAYHARVIPAGPGWLDMGMDVPVMDTTRAKSELGWRPTRTAAGAVAELLDGMRQHRGTRSPALRPDDTSMPTTKPDPVTTPGRAHGRKDST